MRQNLPPKENFIGKTIPEFPTHVITDHVASGANGHTFRAHSEPENSTLAFKFVPTSNLVAQEKAQYLQEAQRANILQDAAVRHIRVVDHTDDESGITGVVFVCEYVDGKSLEEWLRDSGSHADIDLDFIQAFLEAMFRLLFELQERGLEHGDLHAGNVLVVRSPYDVDDRVVFRVTDFGVRQFVDASKRADDYLNVALTLGRLLKLVDFRDASGLDRFIYDALRDRFSRRWLLETDPTVDNLARNPRAMLQALRSLKDEYRRIQSEQLTGASLATPFDYPNCEQIGDSHFML